MTSQSRKKRLTTALTFTPVRPSDGDGDARDGALPRLVRRSRSIWIRPTLFASIVASLIASPGVALAQTPAPSAPAGNWRPSPKLNAAPASSRSANAHDATRPGWNLAWQTPATAQPSAQNSAPQASGSVQQVGGTSDLQARANPVRSAAFLQPPTRTDAQGVVVPVPRPDANANARRPAAGRANNFFDNPFGDDRVASPKPRHRTRQVAAQVDELFGNPGAAQAAPQPVNPIADPTRPSADAVPNSLRGDQSGPGFGLPDNADASLSNPFQDDLPAPAPSELERPESSSDNIRDLIESDDETENLPAPIEATKDGNANLLEDNPFDRDDENAELEKLRRDLNLDGERGRDGGDEPRSALDDRNDDEQQESGKGVSCDDFRKKVSADSIRNISLDPSPPLRPDVIDLADFEEVRAEFLEKQSLRQWRAIDGTPLAVGYLRDLAYENVIIETEYGGVEELPKEKLSEADLAYVTDKWGLPKECLLEQVAYQPRRWRPMTMTWKASNLCHKPLYFEEVNLERYGHTAGPILQPIVSSAHFFANIAVLPYKMGVHSPHECQYALGYYRPGNCAPWIVPPVPISARGAAFQTAAMVGGAWLIP